jgi:exodeoxyribonuclease V alpha subunit
VPEIREAVIRNVVWQKADNAWAIVRTTDKLNESWKGPIGEDLTPGTWVKAEGYVGPKEGRWPAPFVVTRVIQIEVEKPDIPAAWLRWRLPDIGEVRATELSQKYGRGLPDVLDDDAQARAALSAIKGLTPARVKKIQETYRDYPGELRLAIWLAEPKPEENPETGMKWVAIKTVIEEYKRDPEAIYAQANEDPFEFMALDGITFTSADALAEGLGIAENDPRRLRGMVWEKLEDLAGGQGVCVLPRADLLMRMSKYGHSPGELEKIFSESPHFRLGVQGAQLSRIASAEEFVAERTREMLAGAQQRELIDVMGLPEWLDPSQRAAVENLLQVPIAILTGGPGTGKTTVLKAALEQMEKRGERIRLASPTGKAAKRMTETTGRPAQTVHKLLEWKPDGFDRDTTNPVDADVVVVDEASMLDIELASSLFQAIADGTRLILVGDVDQLPPVGPGQPLLDLLRSGDPERSGSLPVFRLTKTHRQKADSWVIDNAARILEGKIPSLKDQSDFRFRNIRDSEGIIEAAIQMYRIAREAGPAEEKQLQVLTPEHKAGAGTQALNTEIQKALNPRVSDSRFADDHVQGVGENKIYVGDKVFYTKNNAELGLVNGSMGVVEKIEIGQSNEATVRFEGDVNPETGDNVFTLVDADVRPLMLAYAMTVHKAQGSEWSNVVVVADDVHFSMRRKLLYTAITRTNKYLTILGSEAAVARGARNNPDENRATLLQQRLRGEEV